MLVDETEQDGEVAGEEYGASDDSDARKASGHEA